MKIEPIIINPGYKKLENLPCFPMVTSCFQNERDHYVNDFITDPEFGQ